MKKKSPAAAEKRRKYDHTSGRVRLILLPALAIVLTLIVESFNRGSVGKMAGYIVTHPIYFSYNVLIVLTSLSLSELFKHRRSVLFTVCVAWLGLGLAAFLVVKQRIQPFTSMDILAIKDAITLTPIYYTWPQIIAMFGGIFLAVVLAIWIITRLPKRRHVNYTRSLCIFCGLVLACFCVRTMGLSAGYFPPYFDSLVDAYDQYGFATCFTFTFGEMGVKQPSEYSAEKVTGILDEVDGADPVATAEPTTVPGPHVFGEDDNLAQPNIIYVQLESLFDVNTIIGSSYSADPTPNFNELSRKYASGELYVPSIGGGTANVEFEMLTGMNLDFFGAGEYPYNTILQETTMESVAYNLREQGYATTAMHNHTGTFYSRNQVYGHLGFEHFVSVEYMPYLTYTDVGWAQDIVMADEIIKAMEATEKRDFVMAITVESHGKYDENYTYTEGDPEIIDLPDQISRGRFSNYLHLIHETDKFIGKLIKDLESYDEPVVCVFYGDHLPALDLTADILTTNNLYASRYIIWNNYGAELEAPNLQAYRVSANLLKQLGMTGGVITKYHQAADITAENDPDYLDKLQVLEYDLLYGDKSSYPDGVNPYEPVDLVMGSVPIEITSVSRDYGRVLVNGKNFTEHSAILLDGAAYPTAFVSSAQIIAIVPRTTSVNEVCVAQLTSDGTELSRTEPFLLAAAPSEG